MQVAASRTQHAQHLSEFVHEDEISFHQSINACRQPRPDDIRYEFHKKTFEEGENMHSGEKHIGRLGKPRFGAQSDEGSSGSLLSPVRARIIKGCFSTWLSYRKSK
jgi:hypothetical protein